MKMSTGISVVIPAFNASRSIKTAVQSAWAVPVQEIVVVDDGSTDDTAAIALELGCVVVAQPNGGAAAARRKGVTLTTQPFVILLDSDDALVAIGVRESLRLVIADERCSGALGATTALIGKRRQRLMIPWAEGINLASLLERGMAPGPPGSFLWRSASIRRALVGNQLPERLNELFAEDYETVVRVSLSGVIVTHNTLASEYAVNGGKSSKDPLESNLAAERIRRYYAQSSGLIIRLRGKREIHALARFRTAYGESRPGRRMLMMVRAIAISPSLSFRLFCRATRRFSKIFFRLALRDIKPTGELR